MLRSWARYIYKYYLYITHTNMYLLYIAIQQCKDFPSLYYTYFCLIWCVYICVQNLDRIKNIFLIKGKTLWPSFYNIIIDVKCVRHLDAIVSMHTLYRKQRPQIKLKLWWPTFSMLADRCIYKYEIYVVYKLIRNEV